MIATVASGKNRRTRRSTAAFAGLPPLSQAQRAVLLRWLKSDARERSWQVLLDAAGAEQLDSADGLLQALLNAGALALKEEFRHAHWQPWRVVWRDLAALQRAAGLVAAPEREAAQQNLLEELRHLAQTHPELSAAVDTCMGAALAQTTLQARAQLLQALAQWRDEQRDGLRRDFALAARGHTKAITAAEWDWLDAQLPLAALGIARFEPLLWLGGALSLRRQDLQIDLRSMVFCGLPSKQFAAPLCVAQGPSAYWLIENRASFERQARQLEAGVCLIWLPGRPGNDWLAALAWLIAQAPAPGRISCDPDPAGIQIALAAGQLWEQAGLPWCSAHMAPGNWKNGKTQALNDYDRRVLAELQAQPGLPAELQALRDYLLGAGHKAEQEGWL